MTIESKKKNVQNRLDSVKITTAQSRNAAVGGQVGGSVGALSGTVLGSSIGAATALATKGKLNRDLRAARAAGKGIGRAKKAVKGAPKVGSRAASGAFLGAGSGTALGGGTGAAAGLYSARPSAKNNKPKFPKEEQGVKTIRKASGLTDDERRANALEMSGGGQSRRYVTTQRQGESRRSQVKRARANTAFEESKHRRGQGGKFASKGMTEAPGSKKPFMSPETEKKVTTGLLGLSGVANVAALKASYKETKGAGKLGSLQGLSRGARAAKIASHAGAKVAFPLAGADLAAGVLAAKVINKPKEQKVAKSVDDLFSKARGYEENKHKRDNSGKFAAGAGAGAAAAGAGAVSNARDARDFSAASANAKAKGEQYGRAGDAQYGRAEAADMAGRHARASDADKQRLRQASSNFREMGRANHAHYHSYLREAMSYKDAAKGARGRAAGLGAVAVGAGAYGAKKAKDKFGKAYDDSKHSRNTNGQFRRKGGPRKNPSLGQGLAQDGAALAGIYGGGAAGAVGVVGTGEAAKLVASRRYASGYQSDAAGMRAKRVKSLGNGPGDEFTNQARHFKQADRAFKQGKAAARVGRRLSSPAGVVVGGVGGALAGGYAALEPVIRHQEKKAGIRKNMDTNELFEIAKAWEPETKRAAKTGVKWGAGIEGAGRALVGGALGTKIGGPKMGAKFAARGAGQGAVVGGAWGGGIGAAVGAHKAKNRQVRSARQKKVVAKRAYGDIDALFEEARS